MLCFYLILSLGTLPSFLLAKFYMLNIFFFNEACASHQDSSFKNVLSIFNFHLVPGIHPNAQFPNVHLCLSTTRSPSREGEQSGDQEGSPTKHRTMSTSSPCARVCQTQVLEDLEEFKTIHKINKRKWHISLLHGLSLDSSGPKFSPCSFLHWRRGGSGARVWPFTETLYTRREGYKNNTESAPMGESKQK